MATKPKTAAKPKRQKIDADTWAESGGSAGIFGKLWKLGQLEIVDSDEQIVPTLTPGTGQRHQID